MKNIYVIIGLVVLIAVTGGVLAWKSSNQGPGQLDGFAQCIKDKGAVFYGAFWCPHCQNQKMEFGSSAKYLPYVECSTPDGQEQTQECKDKEIKSYPTWTFANGDKQLGEISLSDLASRTGCVLPQGNQ
ncbi:MAG: thioredoxin domain-containing protein [Candidatus Liptonbacteria bacterium]